MMNSNSIYKLSQQESRLIKAGGRFSSLYSIVYELVLNSLDAKANNIDIGIDKRSLEIVIRDNGNGITADNLRSVLFETITTSISSELRYGGRGESIYLVCSLAHVTIVSRHQASELTYEKSTVVSPDLPHEFSLRTIGRSQPGTIVVVKNLFEKLPVRRRAICVDQELIKLKELIRFLSIVHYTVNFNIYPLHKGKAILELPAQLTLLERLSFLHNLDLSKHFACVNGKTCQYTLSGVLSHPRAVFNCVGREGQYFYVHRCGIARSHTLCVKIDQICCGVLSRVDGLSFSGGPKPSHYNINQDSQSGLVAKSHPFFVLNLTFPVDSMIDHHRFDLDGSATVLEDSNLVRDCMYLLLKDFYSRYGDVYSTAFEKTWAETGKLSSSVAGTRVVYSQQFMSEKRKIPPSPADSHGIVLSVKSCSKTSTSLAVASDVPERRVLPSLSPLFHVAKSSLLPSSSPWPSPDLHWTNSPWSQYSCNPTSVDKGLRVHSSTGTSDKITTYCFFPDIREKQDSADDFESTFFSPSSNKVTDLFPSTKSTNQNKQCDYFIDENALLPGFGVSVSRRTLPNYEDADYGILHEDLTRSSKLGKTLHQQGRFAVYGPLGGFGTELKLDHSVVGPSVESHPPYHDLIGKLPNDSMSDPPTEYTTQRMDHQQYFLQPLNDSSSLKVHSSVDLDMDFLPAESQLLAKRRYVGGGVNERKMMSPLEAIAIPTRISNTESMINRLDVSDIESCKTIGQFDNKFIFALSQSGTLLGFDQHAVDERVQLEASYNRMCNCGFVCVRCVDFQSSPTEGSKRESLLVVDPPTRISLTESEAHILSLKTNLVRQWGFNVNTISSNYTTDKSEMSKCAKQGKSTVIMEITSFPVFLGESLRVGDLIEFLHWLEQNLDLPLVLLRPPALSRIFASKACRNSIKFGDSLSHMESQELLARLSHTQLPFQCAHGRPSVAPILYLNDILHSRSADKESYENVSCSSCFCN